MARVIIVGAGLAGLTVARELRTLAPDLQVTVVTADDGHQYPKPQLSTGLRLGKQPDALIIQRAEALAAKGIEVVPRTRVTAVRPDARAIDLDDGRTLTYQDLVLALGAAPFAPPMEGTPEAALSVNHLDEYRRFRERLVPDAPALVIGAGLIGLEFTADLTSQGHPVHVVDPGPGALPRLLPPGAAGLVASALQRAGAHFHWGRTVRRLDGPAGEHRATLSDGMVLEAATVLSAVGLRPHTALASEAGLAVGRGIRVDGHLRAAPNVYALGDCAELPGGLYLPFIRPISDQAKFVARAIAGQAPDPLPLGNYTITVKVPAWPIASTTPLPGEAGAWEEAVTETGSLSKLVAPDGRLLRVVATGDRADTLKEWLPQVPSLAGPYPRSAARAPL